MARSIFFELVSVKKFLDNGFSPETTLYQNKKDFVFATKVFEKLISCLEDCPFSKSQSTAFICKHWDKDVVGLAEAWELEFGSKKSVDTFRSQLSTISNQLHSIFGSNLQDMFVSNDKEGLQILLDSICVLENGDFSISELVLPELLSYCEDYKHAEKTFSLDECENELRAMSTLSRRKVFDYLDTLDCEKLSFLAKSLNKPLLDARNRNIEVDKLRVLRALYNIDSESFYALEPVGIVDNKSSNDLNYTTSVENKANSVDINSYVIEGKTDTVCVKNLHGSDILIESSLFDVYESHAIGGVYKEDSETAQKLARMIRSLLDKNYVDEFLSKYSSDDIYTALEILKKEVKKS